VVVEAVTEVVAVVGEEIRGVGAVGGEGGTEGVAAVV
jgi:hypothetical protein